MLIIFYMLYNHNHNNNNHYYSRCDLLHKKVIIVKSNHHFRASLSPIATSIITTDGGGLGSVILSNKVNYNNVRRPIWPLDNI